MALEIQLQVTKIHLGKAQKPHENMVQPIFLTYACTCLTVIVYTQSVVLITIPYPMCFVEPSRQPQVCKFDT